MNNQETGNLTLKAKVLPKKGDYSAPGLKLPGFTLIELVVTLAIVAVLVTVVAPSFRNLILANKTTRYTNDLVQALYAARAEAIKQTELVTITALNASSASNEWGPGLRVWLDADSDSSYDAGEEIRIMSSIDPSQTIDGPNGTSTFNFLPNGGISATSITFSICDSRSGETGRSVTISARGQIRSAEFSCS